MRTSIIICALVNPYRKHANGGSEDIRRRIEAVASIADSVLVYAIDYHQECFAPQTLLPNVQLRLYSRGNDPRPWRWRYPLACIRRYNHRMMTDVRRKIAQCTDSLVIVVEGMQLFGLWLDIKGSIPAGARTILRVHNIESAYHYSVATESRGLLKLAHQVSSLQYGPLESRLLSDFSYLYAISEKEAEALMLRYRLSPDKIKLVLPIPADNPCSTRAKREGVPFILSYFGDLTLPNNYVGVCWFCDNVLPKLSEDVELHVAGKGSERFSAYERVRVHGFVKDIDAFACQSQIVVAPIFSGAGVKIKVLDAIGYGKPLITTPKGAEGLPEWLIDQVYVACDANEFVDLLNGMMASYDNVAQKSEVLQKEVSRRLGVPHFQRQFFDDIEVFT